MTYLRSITPAQRTAEIYIHSVIRIRMVQNSRNYIHGVTRIRMVQFANIWEHSAHNINFKQNFPDKYTTLLGKL